MLNTLEQTGIRLNSNASITEISETDYPATDIGKGKMIFKPKKTFALDDVQEGSDQNDSADGVPKRVVSRHMTPLPEIDPSKITRDTGPLPEINLNKIKRKTVPLPEINLNKIKRETGPLFYERSSE